MAEENESLILGVEYAGSEGVNQFVSSLQPLPGQVEAVFQRLSKDVGDTSVWRQKGQEIARAYVLAAQAEMAGFKPSAIPLDPAGTVPGAEYQRVRDAMRSLREEQRKIGEGPFQRGGPEQAAALGIRDVERASQATIDAQRRLRAELAATEVQLARMNRVRADDIRGPELTRSPFGERKQWEWSQYAKSGGVSLSGVPVPLTSAGTADDAAAKRLYEDLLERSTRQAEVQNRAAREQLATLQGAPILQREPQTIKKAMEPVVQASAPAPSLSRLNDEQQRIVQAIAGGDRSLRAISREDGFTYNKVQRANKDFAPEIAQLQRQYQRQAEQLRIIEALARGDRSLRQIVRDEGFTYNKVQRANQNLQPEIAARRAEIEAEQAAAEAVAEARRERDRQTHARQTLRRDADQRDRSMMPMEEIGREYVEGVPGVRVRPVRDADRSQQVRDLLDPFEEASNRARQRDQFDLRLEPTRPRFDDAIMREWRNVTRGGQGFGQNGMTEALREILDTDTGDGPSPAARLNESLERWTRQQDRGGLYSQRVEYQGDPSRGITGVWDRIPLSPMEIRDRDHAAAAPVNARWNIDVNTEARRLLSGDQYVEAMQRIRTNRAGIDYRLERDGEGKLRQVGAVRGASARGVNLPEENILSEADRTAQRARLTQAFGGEWGFRQQFASGFRGPNQGNYEGLIDGEMVGQTARIALFYGAAYRGLNMLQQALALVTQETLAYETALTDLNVATQRGRGENQDLASDLTSTAAGAAFAPSVGVALGARSVGLYGTAQSSQEVQERTARISAEVSTRVARVAGGDDPVAVQTQLAGALRSFGYGVDRLASVEDSITYIARNTGQSPTELLGATSNIATLGRSSGFTPEQLMSIVAQVGTTTGQNPEATAGQFRQVLSREFDAVAESAQSVFGLDTSSMTSVAQVLEAVSSLEMTQQQVNDFTATFGKGGSQTVAMITLENWDRIQELSSGATSATGMGEATFDTVMGNIGNRLTQFGAELGKTGLALVDTGILDWFGALVSGASEVMSAGGQLINIFNEIPRPIRSVALALAEVYAVSRLIGMSKLGGSIKALAGISEWVDGLGSTARTAGVGSAVTQGAADVRRTFVGDRVSGSVFRLSEADRAERRLRARNPELSRGQRVGARVQGVTGLTGLGVVGALAGAAVVGQQVADAFGRLRDATTELEETQLAEARARTEDEYRDVAARARTAANAVEANTLDGLAVGDVMNLLPATFAHLTTGDEQAKLRQIEADATAEADRIAARRKEQMEADASLVFNDFSAEGVEETLATLDGRGYSAAQQLDLLNEAMFRFSDAVAGVNVDDVTTVLAKGQFEGAAEDTGRALTTAFAQASGRQKLNVENLALNRSMNPFEDGTRMRRAASAAKILDIDPKRAAELEGKLSDAVLEQLNSMSSGDMALLADSDVAAIRAKATDIADEALSMKEWQALGPDIRKEVENSLVLQIQGIFDAFGGDLTTDNLSTYLKVLPGLAEGAGAEELAATGSQSAAAEAVLAELMEGRAAIAQVDDQGTISENDLRLIKQIDQLIVGARRDVVESRISDIQRLASLDQARLADDDIAGRLEIEARSLEQQADEAYRAYTEAGVELDPNAKSPYQYRARDEESLRGYQDAQSSKMVTDRARAMNALRERQAALTMNVSPGDSIGTAATALTATNMALESGLYTSGSVEWAGLVAARTQQAFSLRQSQIQGVNANALANIDPRATRARIAQEIANVRREMALFPAGDPQTGQLRDQLNSLRQQQAEAAVAEVNALASSRIAGRSSALDAAEVNVRNARRSLSTQLKGTEGYYNALSELRNAQAVLAEQERAQADRMARLDSDLTDPVEQARLDVETALAKFRADKKAGEGDDVIAQDRLDVRSARNQAEAAAFDQRLSDVQVAEDLGRMSHSAYMGYLQSEHDRLASIADRTRQQQDQLNQVDQLMKAAAEEMQGQFNIGEIDLPTIYEARRALGSGAPSQVADYSNSNNVVQLNGVDFATVLEYLEGMIGPGAQVVRSGTRRI